MNRLLKFWFIFVIFATPARVLAVSSVEEITEQLNTVFQCPEKVWPGLTKEHYRIIFASPSSQTAWLWKSQDSSTLELSPQQFPFPPALPQYLFHEFEGERVVVINLEESEGESPLKVSKSFALAFHEGFHWLFQMKEPWVAQFSSAERKVDLDYSSAVYFRKMLIRALKRELLNSNENFGNSSYWYHKWLALGEAPETRYSDVMEGTAKYAEVVASIIAVHGCGVSEKIILNDAKSVIDSYVDLEIAEEIRKDFFKEYLESGYQLEGYEIGLLSLLSMRSKGHVVGENEFLMGRDFMAEFGNTEDNSKQLEIMADLQKALSQVKAPADLLLEDVSAEEEQDDTKLLETVKRLFSELGVTTQ